MSSSRSVSQRLPTKSLEMAEEQHVIHCNCDAEQFNILTRGFLSLRPKTRTESCCRATEWLQKCNAPPHALQMYMELVISDVSSPEHVASVKQIELDLLRTYPDEKYFSSEKGKRALRRCLTAYSIYDSSIGYVQGMNFIMAALLWHCTEEDAFWLFVSLMEDYELRDTYLPKLPGLSKHCQIIQLLVLEFLPDVHKKLAEHRIDSEMYATEWCFTLFGSVVPVNQMHHLIGHFFHHGWSYFYRFVIVLLNCLEPKLEEASDPIEVLASLKISRSQADWNRFLSERRLGLDWNELNARAFDLEIDEEYITKLHRCFCLQRAQFMIRHKQTSQTNTADSESLSN